MCVLKATAASAVGLVGLLSVAVSEGLHLATFLWADATEDLCAPSAATPILSYGWDMEALHGASDHRCVPSRRV